ncbi:uncharacterized protein N7496_012444 [Penicillium cataractarum]|uniref:Uncharacterized protein n=1 Tax=Penicillium cataractarum TaxID=2100454 RepID=A0A9W9R7L9_9EURO|nr:uncharacterized protein N7496_012444 [Penicillium cataractarum]KAJ5355232.1 hypothetical protein N7496_012444 [Penicillium cataractarum]
MAYRDFQYRLDRLPNEPRSPLLDDDGAPLYETQEKSLLIKIIRQNDTTRLQQYISAYSGATVIAPSEAGHPWFHDPFWVAAAYGNTETWQLLLEQYDIASAGNTPSY